MSDYVSSSYIETTEQAELQAHLIDLPGGSWGLWRWAGLRGAGFPLAHLLTLAAPGCAEAADRLLEAENCLQRAQAEALHALRAALQQAAHDRERSGRISKAMRQIKKGNRPAALVDDDGAEAVAALLNAAQQVDTALADLHQTFQAATVELGQALHEIARDDRFRSAVIWQNRQALQAGIDSVLRKAPGTSSSKNRRNETLIANYMQRYCAKNDTIGFFGPVAWARFESDGPAINMQPGPTLMLTRKVYFESWCIDALAETFAKDEQLLLSVAPRRLPHVRLDGLTLHLPFAPPLKLPRSQAVVLQACDGQRSAKEIASALCADPESGMRNEAEVYAILKTLRATRRIAWTLEIPSEGAYPEVFLRELLLRVDDQPAREQALAALTELEDARDTVAQASAHGSVEQLNQAMADLEATFTRLTGVDATRNAGMTYAARTPIYEDGRRNITVDLGPTILDALGSPLTLLLTSARWLTFKVAERYRMALRKIYDDLAQEAGSPTVDFASFWLVVQNLVTGEEQELIEALRQEFQEKWATILALPVEERAVTYRSADLQPLVQEVFAAPNAGWLGAHYHSPDIMIAACGAEAIERGDYQLVLGEMHPGLNTLSAQTFVLHHPEPETLFAAVEKDLSHPRIIPVLAKRWPAPTSRTLMMLMTPKDLRLIYTPDACGVDQSQALLSSALVIEADGVDLVVRTRDGERSFDICEIFAHLLTGNAIECFKLLLPERHTPRITIDRLVVHRETWRFAASDLTFLLEDDYADRFVAVRRWAKNHGIPRFIFLKVPIERKPCYIDLDSPIFIDIFARLVRRVLESDKAEQLIAITEMLPAPDQLWLADADGHLYTSELRIIALDREREITAAPYR